jgi:hypothetical protein
LGASAAIAGATLGPLTISSDGKTATAVLSCTGVEETKTITGIDTSGAYNAGWNNCKPTSVTGGTPSYQGGNQYTVALTAKNSVGTIVGTGTCSVDARDAYDDGCDTEAASLAISPNTDTSLDFGETTTVTATTANNSTGKSVTITAPEMPDIRISGGSTNQTSCRFYITCGDKSRTITVRAGIINPSGSPTG